LKCGIPGYLSPTTANALCLIDAFKSHCLVIPARDKFSLSPTGIKALSQLPGTHTNSINFTFSKQTQPHGATTLPNQHTYNLFLTTTMPSDTSTAPMGVDKAAQAAGFKNFNKFLKSHLLRHYINDDVEEGKAILRAMGYNVQ
jgi:hypothetical protein